MKVNDSNEKPDNKRKFKPEPTQEFVMEDGTDATLWGDIESEADRAWRDRVWQRMKKEHGLK